MNWLSSASGLLGGAGTQENELNQSSSSGYQDARQNVSFGDFIGSGGKNSFVPWLVVGAGLGLAIVLLKKKGK